MRLCSLGSGSSGNCILVSTPSTHILIDCGIPLSRIEQDINLLGVQLSDISAVLLTHTHIDHTASLSSFVRKASADVYVSNRSLQLLAKYNIPFARVVPFDGDFIIGDINVSPFAISHDVPCVGYSLYNLNKKISVLTDLGHVTPTIFGKLKSSNLVMIESNHDEDMVLNNEKYSAFLKRRILSPQGHLSNQSCAEVVARLVQDGTKQFLLAHLSEENNYPELARSTVKDFLIDQGIPLDGVDIEVALAKGMSSLFEIM